MDDLLAYVTAHGSENQSRKQGQSLRHVECLEEALKYGYEFLANSSHTRVANLYCWGLKVTLIDLVAQSLQAVWRIASTRAKADIRVASEDSDALV